MTLVEFLISAAFFFLGMYVEYRIIRMELISKLKQLYTEEEVEAFFNDMKAQAESKK